ncbi:MAG: glycosyltransferase family 2 protein [Thermales bacterium]|nr:glycosyltransferase family 2 protein [Thermales bacterium]
MPKKKVEKKSSHKKLASNNTRLKLIIQINCFNEESSLPISYKDLPKSISGIDVIETLIVDDGSSDQTGEIAAQLGVDHIIRHNGNRGLPAAVNTGVLKAIQENADILVNTDADNQYEAKDIAKLVQPIIAQKADYVYGQRPIMDIQEFSSFKKYLQLAGAKVVGWITKLELKDAASGFRAMNREAMQKYFLLAQYSSPLEGLIQAKMKKLSIKIININTNPSIRPSRLFQSKSKYVFKSATIILDNILIYRPLQTFLTLGTIFFLIGIALTSFRIYLLNFTTTSSDHLTLLMTATITYILSIQLYFLGLFARLQRANKLQSDEILYRINTKI